MAVRWHTLSALLMTASELGFSVLSGEYIAVEKVESIYKKNLIVEQVWAGVRTDISGNLFNMAPTRSGLGVWQQLQELRRGCGRAISDRDQGVGSEQGHHW